MPAHRSTATDYETAFRDAQAACNALKPFCTQIEIAGSLRRQKPWVKDAEIVCIPKSVPVGLFSDAPEVDPNFCAIVKRWTKVKGEPTGRYTQRVLPSGLTLDLFMADAESFGNILLIRTGDRDFSQWMMGTRLPKRGYQAKDGAIWKDGVKIATPEEQDVFALAGLAWITPSQRIGLELHR